MPIQSRPSAELPIEAGKTAEVIATALKPRRKPGVLLVDNDHLIRVMLQLGLERKGFDVLLAPNGREAIQLYREHRESIAVVLLDAHMEGLDGPATLDALRRLNPSLPACFTCSETDGYKPEELIRRGAAHVFIRPFLLEDLADILGSLVRGSSVALAPAGTAFEGKIRQ
jgi:CheY-like chemotaxis protein